MKLIKLDLYFGFTRKDRKILSATVADSTDSKCIAFHSADCHLNL